MKTTSEIEMTQTQNIMDKTVPMFMPKNLEKLMADKATTDKMEAELSVFDVKELYDLAYAEKAKGGDGAIAFKKILAEAIKLDLTYRRQLAKKSFYKTPSKLKNFKDVAANTKVASA